MLAERDPNGSGRTSRASNLSVMSRATYRTNGGADKQDLLASAPGVMSMLRTTTEMGNLAGLAGDVSGVGNVPRAPQRRGTSSRLSMASSMSGTSSRASRHHRQWPSSSSAPRRPSAREPSGPQYVADTLSPTVMDLPGSSPLVPMRYQSSRNNRDSQRSFSLTTTSQPTFRLSSNRSLGSLRSHELIQRPKSPYVYPTRLRRPSYRPASPALSDATGSCPRRLHGHGSQGQIQHQGPMRLRMPSDTSLGYQDRAPGMPRHPSRGHHYHNGLQGDTPPVPPFFHPRVPFERSRAIQSSLKGSFSSGSTNMRNDSDTPSSDLPSPPTPRDGSSLEVVLSPTGTQLLVDTMSGIAVKEEIVDGPLYYDYSEQFEREEILEPEINPIMTGFVKNSKTIQEERGPCKQHAYPTRGGCNSRTLHTSDATVPGIVELPASPVPRRITRDMILAALGPASTTEEINGTGEAITVVDTGQDSIQATAPTSNGGVGKRFSILSQADSSVVNSSTLDFAVRCSIPIVTEDKMSSDAPPVPERDPPLPPDTAPSTEVDMSDLLAGYQHTESRHEDESVAKDEEKETKAEASTDRNVESRSSHAQQPSDPQSFKSATDVLEPERSKGEPDGDDDAKSCKSFPGAMVDKELPIKEIDAYSFKTAQGTATPGRSISVPVTKALPVVPADMPTPRPTSDIPLSTPVSAVLRKPRVPPRESSFPLAKVRTSSKPSMKQRSVSISGSSSTLNGPNQPPPVPARESSASKEAQRSMGVASWMLFKRWTKKAVKDETLTKSSNSSRDTLRETCPLDSVASSQFSPADIIPTPEKALFKGKTISRKPVGIEESDQRQVCNASAIGPPHRPSLSSPELVIAQPPSVDPSKDSSAVSCVRSSPAGVPRSVDNCRNSQTTTHLAWHGRSSLNLNKPAASISEPHLPLSPPIDETTTDLRLSQYRYGNTVGLHYLPDLKEESHEDSSLNTSASNLKNSNFRFPFGVPGGVRASVDDGALFSRRSSMGSYRKSALGSELSQTHELPSMRFSRMDLFDKVDEVVRLRSSRSLDPVQVEVPELHAATPQRPVSAGEVREKYRSFFERLDQLDTPRDVARADINGPMLMRRMAEIEQVTVPSVNGLTERLSEMLPSLKEYYKIGDQGTFAAEEMIMEHALEDIHEVGGPAQKRSSARLRPMPGSPHMVVIEDALYEELTNKEKEDDAAVPQCDQGVECTQGEYRASEMTKANSSTRPKTPLAELPTLSPTLLRPRAVTVDNSNLRASVESGLTTRSLRSLTSTPTKTDTRPWNSDRNYPWAATTVPFVDISLPLPTALKPSPRPGPSHLRNNLSDTSILHRFSQFGRNLDQPHEAGERYPTSALTPPSAIFRDDFSTSDTSDDDTELQVTRKGKFSLKNRFSLTRNPTVEHRTRARNRTLNTLNNSIDLISSGPAHCPTHQALQDPAGEARVFTSNRHTFRDAQGMPSVQRTPSSKLFSEYPYDNIYPPIKMATNGVPKDYMQAIMMGNYQQHENYKHYKSVEFARSLWVMNVWLHYHVQEKVWPRCRSWGVPNTPVMLEYDEYLAYSRYGFWWGPDDDYYTSMREGYWF
ncbi:hypothetical protein SVAN01_03747 [Stagonosporopsis vannaccii]|nr:hypothetical protein SVAN01_03747 [Stagonosporopsis vannaccii]